MKLQVQSKSGRKLADLEVTEKTTVLQLKHHFEKKCMLLLLYCCDRVDVAIHPYLLCVPQCLLTHCVQAPNLESTDKGLPLVVFQAPPWEMTKKQLVTTN